MSRSPIEIRRLSGALGAEVLGVDLAAEPALPEVRQAFADHAVLAFRDQKLTREDQLAFARQLGTPEVHPIVEGTDDHPEVIRVWKPAGEPASFGTGWHTDNSFFPEPSLGSTLYAVEVPPYGGDTLYASMEAAYEALSPAMKAFLGPLRAIHSASRAYDPAVTGREKYEGKAPIRYRYSESIREEVSHPVVRTHPDTGRKSLYVNQMFTQRIEGLERGESDALLAFLYEHATRPEFTCRLRWQPGTLALWDNRCVQHYAMDDYREFDRLMFRVTIAGERPV